MYLDQLDDKVLIDIRRNNVVAKAYLPIFSPICWGTLDTTCNTGVVYKISKLYEKKITKHTFDSILLYHCEVCMLIFLNFCYESQFIQILFN